MKWDKGFCEWKDNPDPDFRKSYQLWKIDVHRDFNEFQKYVSFLDPGERANIWRFRQPEDQKVKTISLIIRKLMASAYLEKGSKAFQFDQNEFGKPFLSSNAEKAFHFNISHNSNYVIFFCGPSACGVDVEMQRSMAMDSHFLKDVFHEEEILYLHRQVNQEEAFFKLWVLKEALFKRLGSGIPERPHGFSIFDKVLNHGEAASGQKSFVQAVYRLPDDHFLGLNYQGDAETPLHFIDFEKGKGFLSRCF